MALTELTKKKISDAKKGKKFTEKHKLSLSIAHKGMPSPLKGKKRLNQCGENHWMWRGGRSKGYKTGYYSLEYKQWRSKVFERDGFTCQICRKIGVYLTAHHIKSFAHYPKLRFDLNNGITLCEECHKLTDNYKGRNKNKQK